MLGCFSRTKSQYYVDFTLRTKGVFASVFFFKLIALTAEKVFVSVMQIDLLVCQPVENFCSLSSMLVCDAYYLHCCILDRAIYVQWQPITALPSPPLPPGESSGCSRTSQSREQLVELTSLSPTPPLLRIERRRICREVIWLAEGGGGKDREVRSLEKHHMAERGFTQGHCQWLV